MSRFFLISFCMVLLGAATSMAVTVDTTSDLLLHLTYDNVANLGADSSGNGYDCTPTNESLILYDSAGVIGGAADFTNPGDGSYGYFNAPTVPVSEVPTSALTISAWINLDRLYNDTYTGYERNCIFSTMAEPDGVASTTKGTGGISFDIRGVKRDNGDSTYSYEGASYRVCLRGEDALGERNAHTIVDYTYGSAGEVDPDTGETLILPERLNEWYHVATTYDKATATAALYIDGRKVIDLPVVDAIDIDTDWYRAQVARYVEAGRQLYGGMDDLRIYTRALDQYEIAELALDPLIPGDANDDGKVDGSDVTILAGNWQVGVDGTQTASWSMGDFNGDGKVDGSDVTILAGNWQYGVTAAAASVPEPATLVLLLSAIGSLLIWKRM